MAEDPAPRRRRARPRVRVRPLAGAAGATALVACVAMLGAFLEALNRAGVAAADLRTVGMVSLFGATAYLGLTADADRRPGPGLTGFTWLMAGVLIVLVLRWPHDALRVASSDEDGIALNLVGVLFGAVTGATGRWLLLGGVRERAPDTSG